MSLKIPYSQTARKFRGTFGVGSGPSGRIKRLRMCVTGLIRHERIESTFARCDETRGYAERLINIASKHGDKDKYAMEVADYWLLEKDLIHKLFKVIVPRYENNRSSYTKLYMLPKELPGYGKDMGVLELKDNPWPQVVPKQRETKYFLTNMLVDELRKEHHRTKRSPFVNKILDTSADNIDIDSIQNQYILDNLVDNDEGKTKNDQSHENKND
ncbi:large ribosomal subunit protein bL17m-like [Mytilus galloprovincialis]|uniref:large ribosomal subunit protein bL17m-like n=1 Tax=Mytilus galloprovincialis TaxID=29158 RepID=UPI003F7C7C95